MFIKNSLSLFVNNINISFKAMLYRLVVVSVCTAIVALISSINLNVILFSEEASNFIDSLRAALSSFIGANYSFDMKVAESYDALMNLVKANISSVIGTIIGIAAFAYVENFLLGVCHFAVTKCVNAHMSSITKLGFTEAIFSSLGTAAPFEAIYAAIKILVVILTVALCGVFAIYTIAYLSLFALIIAVWGMIVIISFYLTITAPCRPSVVNGLGVTAAFKAKYDSKKFWTCFGSFVLALTVAIVVNVLFFATTFGAGLMISLPLTTLFFACLKLVVYYNLNDRKYYIDIDTIITPVKLREDGELLDKVDAE